MLPHLGMLRLEKVELHLQTVNLFYIACLDKILDQLVLRRLNVDLGKGNPLRRKLGKERANT